MNFMCDETDDLNDDLDSIYRYNFAGFPRPLTSPVEDSHSDNDFDDFNIIYNFAGFRRPSPPHVNDKHFNDAFDEIPMNLPISLKPYTNTTIRNKVYFYEDSTKDNPIIIDYDNQDFHNDDINVLKPHASCEEGPMTHCLSFFVIVLVVIKVILSSSSLLSSTLMISIVSLLLLLILFAILHFLRKEHIN